MELNEEITDGTTQQNMQILVFHVDSHHVALGGRGSFLVLAYEPSSSGGCWEILF